MIAPDLTTEEIQQLDPSTRCTLATAMYRTTRRATNGHRSDRRHLPMGELMRMPPTAVASQMSGACSLRSVVHHTRQSRLNVYDNQHSVQLGKPIF